MNDEQPIEARMVTGAIERAQKRVEDRNFGIRKQLLEFDNVMSKQRVVIYQQRRDILLGNDISESVQDMIADYIDSQTQQHLNPELEPEEQDIPALKTAIVDAVPALEAVDFEAFRGHKPEDATDAVVPKMEEAYKVRETELGAPLLRELERFITLQVVDQHWKEQLHNMDVLRQGIGLRGYGQRNPLQEYATEAFRLFEEMTATIKLEVAKLLFRVQVQQQQPLERKAQPRNITTNEGDFGAVPLAAPTNLRQPNNPQNAAQRPTQPIRVEDKVGRNNPCPCGSGKKYKHCHGRSDAAAAD
jgi:preprotein translocase subunit SecA